MTWGVKNATAQIVVGTMFFTGTITILAVGAASILIHCFLVDFVLIN
jgi:hypothetical protein